MAAKVKEGVGNRCSFAYCSRCGTPSKYNICMQFTCKRCGKLFTELEKMLTSQEARKTYHYKRRF
jgi:exosome complex RNA-binding protein Csl4